MARDVAVDGRCCADKKGHRRRVRALVRVFPSSPPLRMTSPSPSSSGTQVGDTVLAWDRIHRGETCV